jgi:hypothetical protein
MSIHLSHTGEHEGVGKVDRAGEWRALKQRLKMLTRHRLGKRGVDFADIVGAQIIWSRNPGLYQLTLLVKRNFDRIRDGAVARRMLNAGSFSPSLRCASLSESRL